MCMVYELHHKKKAMW